MYVPMNGDHDEKQTFILKKKRFIYFHASLIIPSGLIFILFD